MSVQQRQHSYTPTVSGRCFSLVRSKISRRITNFAFLPLRSGVLSSKQSFIQTHTRTLCPSLNTHRNNFEIKTSTKECTQFSVEYSSSNPLIFCYHLCRCPSATETLSCFHIRSSWDISTSFSFLSLQRKLIRNTFCFSFFCPTLQLLCNSNRFIQKICQSLFSVATFQPF